MDITDFLDARLKEYIDEIVWLPQPSYNQIVGQVQALKQIVALHKGSSTVSLTKADIIEILEDHVLVPDYTIQGPSSCECGEWDEQGLVRVSHTTHVAKAIFEHTTTPVVLKFIAAIWSDHPDWDEEWSPPPT